MCVWYDTIPRTYCVSLHSPSCYHFLQWTSKHYHHGMFAPHCRQPLNLGPQAESGAFADTGLLLTTRQIGAVGAMWEKLIPPFYFDINIHLFNNEFCTYRTVVDILPPRLNLETSLVSPCCQHQKWNDQGPQAHREKKITFHFVLWWYDLSFSICTYDPTTARLLTQPPDWIWRHCCCGPAVSS